MLWLHTRCELWGKLRTRCVLFLYFLTSHCCNNNGIRVMFLLISAIDEITRYCCYFPGYFCAVAALCRATFFLQNCYKATSSTTENSDCKACFCNIMQGINSNHIYDESLWNIHYKQKHTFVQLQNLYCLFKILQQSWPKLVSYNVYYSCISDFSVNTYIYGTKYVLMNVQQTKW